MRNSMPVPLLAGVLCLFGALPSYASIIVSLENYSVAPGTIVVENITVTDSTAPEVSDIEGMAFTFQIAEGTGSAPKIVSIDLNGTIWSGHGSVATPSVRGNLDQYKAWDVSTDLTGNYVNANGVLAKVTIDTAGAAPGNYALKLVGTSAPDRDTALHESQGEIVPASFGQGTLTIAVPEPASAFMLGLGVCTFLLGRSRRPSK